MRPPNRGSCATPFPARHQIQLSAPVGGWLAPALPAPVLLHIAVHRDRHEPVRLEILKLDDLMAAPGKLVPAAPLGTSPDRTSGSVT